MGFFTTEITSRDLVSDNPIHQRQLYAYYKALPYIKGNLLEIGCGNGRGYEMLKEHCETYTAIDKNDTLLSLINEIDKHKVVFFNDFFPPFNNIADASMDCIVCFQVIEHIDADLTLIKEMHRVLKVGGQALITTPNRLMSLTRNPWHVREYLPAELTDLLKKEFKKVETFGIFGDELVNEYWQKNKESVQKFTRFDVFNLQHKLPRALLQIPYDIANRLNRKSLQKQDNTLVAAIGQHNFSIAAATDACYDLFAIATKTELN